MMNYLPTTLRSLLAHHPRTTQRLNLKRGPHADPVDLTPEYMPIRTKGMAPQFSPMHHPFGVASAPHLVSFPAVRGLEDMLSSPLGPHILSYEPPRGFVMLSFSRYDGSTDSYDHMLHFNQTMILSTGNDRLLCKVFPASLKGPALA